MTETSLTVPLARVHADLSAAADLLRRAAPLPPMGVLYTPHGTWRVHLAPEPSVAPARQHIALRRLAKRLETPIEGTGQRAWTRGVVNGIELLASACEPDGHDYMGQGATAEHADLLGDLAGWAHAMLEAGVHQVHLRQARVPRLHADHRFRALVYAEDRIADRLSALSADAMGVPATAALAGTALTFTGQDVVVIRERPDEPPSGSSAARGAGAPVRLPERARAVK